MEKLSINEKDFRDYEFILSELKSFVGKSTEQQMQEFMSDPLIALTSGLRTPQGATLFLSAEAHQRFAQISRRGLKSLGVEARRHRPEEVVSTLKREFTIQMFDGFDLQAENAHQIFEMVIERLMTSYSALTYHVPCSLVSQTARQRLSIGPVAFMLCAQFFEQHQIEIREAACTPDGTVIQSLLDRTRAFYGDFQWVASVTVPACDKEISRERAYACVQKALDIFKLIVGSERATHVKQGYDLRVPGRHAEIASSTSGQFSISAGGKLHDAILNDHWYEQVISAPSWPLMESILAHWWERWHDLGEIETRFLDSLAWHSDAISEPNLGAKVVKFWTAIERVLSWPRGSNIAARAAILCSDNAQDFDTKAQSFSNLYQKRSDIIHGDANRSSESWYSEAARCSEEASKEVLFQYLYVIPCMERWRVQTDRKKLQSWLRGIDNLAKRHRQELKARASVNLG